MRIGLSSSLKHDTPSQWAEKMKELGCGACLLYTSWWRIADHTAGNETGRMMVVNGSDPGAVFFRDTVTVQPNTNYLFTAWILNLFKVTGYPNPELGVRILNPEGDVLYSATPVSYTHLLLTQPACRAVHKYSGHPEDGRGQSDDLRLRLR